MEAADLIDLAQYSIDGTGARHADLLRQTQDALAHDGCAVLRGFVKPAAIDLLVAEAEKAAPNAFHSAERTNPYFTKDDPTLPENHPKRRFYDRSNAFIAADNFGAESLLRKIYEWEPFRAFAQAALMEKDFHNYSDPLADVIINAAQEGNGFPWHFDTNNYTLTLSIQNAENGGEFEYAADIRKDGENFEEVEAVLDGRSDRVTSLQLNPGDLQIFKGRYALHRVAPLEGPTPRYVAIFSFVDNPDMVATPERARQLYGRALPIHFERAGRRMDSFID